jgi:hypothetical protein
MSGLHNTAPFQRSGTPLVVSGEGTHTLRYVTKAIVLAAVGGDTTISFAGDDENVFTLPQNQSMRFEVAVDEFTTGANAMVVVELTNINVKRYGDDLLNVTREDLINEAEEE